MYLILLYEHVYIRSGFCFSMASALLPVCDAACVFLLLPLAVAFDRPCGLAQCGSLVLQLSFDWNLSFFFTWICMPCTEASAVLF